MSCRDKIFKCYTIFIKKYPSWDDEKRVFELGVECNSGHISVKLQHHFL